MSKQEQLNWEARVGRLVAIACFVSAAALVAALLYSTTTLNEHTNDTVDGLFVIHRHKADVLATTVLQAISTALLAAPLWFLYRVTRFRRPEVPAIARYLALIAPAASGILAVVRQVQVADVADRVHTQLTAHPLTPDAANSYAKDQLADGALQLVGGLGLAAGLALAFAFILISLNAMRAGVLSRFMGIIGIIVGVLFVIPLLGSVPIIEVFWVIALGLLFVGIWPQGGRGPAWESGEAIPWPTAQQRQEQIAAARADREEARERQAVGVGRRQPSEPEEDEDGLDAHANGTEPAVRQQPAQHPRSKKRKRRRR